VTESPQGRPVLVGDLTDAEAALETQLARGGNLLSELQRASGQSLFELVRQADNWARGVERLLAAMFSDRSVADEFTAVDSGGPSVSAGADQIRASSFRLLEARFENLLAVNGRIRFFPRQALGPAGRNVAGSNKRIFIAHGRDREMRSEVEAYVRRLGLDPVVLEDEAGGMRTIIEKFERYSDVRFAIVILSADDVGKAKAEANLQSRARQNAILELGFFVHALTRDMVVVIAPAELELPSDLLGSGEIRWNSDWKTRLVREIRAAGLEFDVSKT
jgi:predicted nucleotide-binding protein